MTDNDSTGRALEFEAFVQEVVEARFAEEAVDTDRGDDIGVDGILELDDGRTVIFEAKTDTPSTRLRLARIAEQLKAAVDAVSGPAQAILAVPGTLSPEHV